MILGLARACRAFIGSPTLASMVPKTQSSNQQPSRSISSVIGNGTFLKCWNQPRPGTNPFQPWSTAQLAGPRGPILVPSCGMKVKAIIHRRCKDCYMIYIKGLLHNLCRTHGRHKHRLKPKYFKNMRILSGVSQTPIKPW